MMATRCPRCDREVATDADRAHPEGCACPRCVSVCWDSEFGGCQAVDWRARALAAEAELRLVLAAHCPDCRCFDAIERASVGIR